MAHLTLLRGTFSTVTASYAPNHNCKLRCPCPRRHYMRLFKKYKTNLSRYSSKKKNLTVPTQRHQRRPPQQSSNQTPQIKLFPVPRDKLSATPAGRSEALPTIRGGNITPKFQTFRVVSRARSRNKQQSSKRARMNNSAVAS